MRILVTGGNGFIGSVVVRQLIAQGYEVRCLLRATSKTNRLEGLKYERATGDIRDALSIAKALEGCEGVIHLAGLSAWRDIQSPLMPEVVVGGTRNVIAAAKRRGTRMVFVSSSIAINGTEKPFVHDEKSENTLPLDHYIYAKAKIEAERLCQREAKEGLPVVIVNPCEVYGPNDTDLITAGNLKDVAKSNPVMLCHGGTSIVHVDDVAAGIIAAFEKGRSGERYILGGENRSVVELAELVLELLGRKAKIMVMPNSLIRSVASVGGKLRIPLPFEPAMIPYATLYWFMNNRKATEELGVSFRSARDTLQPTLQWLRAAGMA
jgi:dihydroflavonol-4-reductase